MVDEPKNIPLNGLIRVPRELADAEITHRAKFWKLLGHAALLLKRAEILDGIDRWGHRLQPIKRKWGDRTPLLPRGEPSRTYRLLSLNSSARGATLFWKRGGGREAWPTILGYHAYKHGPRRLPVRNVIGLSPRSVDKLMSETEMWQAGYAAGLAAGGGPGRGGSTVPSKPRGPSPETIKAIDVAARRQAEAIRVEAAKKARAAEQVRKLVEARKVKLAKEADAAWMREADRLTREAMAESKAIMDELIRKNAAKKAKARQRSRGAG